jgi:DNA invertase Pin-like site-specific DNA recombinase
MYWPQMQQYSIFPQTKFGVWDISTFFCRISLNFQKILRISEGRNNMFFAYIRVSTDSQSVENQRFAIEEYCSKNSLKVNKWVKETISGKTAVKDRRLGALMNKLKRGDTLICSEISRLGRDMLMLMSVLNECVCKGVRIIAVKGNYRLENNLHSKIFAMAYSISSEVERDFISQRTRDALARKKAEGMKLGHPKGIKNKNKKLTGKEKEIRSLVNDNVPLIKIAQIFNVDRGTLTRFIKDMNI